MIKIQYDVLIKRFWYDNTNDYFNQNLPVFFHKEEIIHESSWVNTPQQNGIEERRNVLLLDIARSLLFHKKGVKTISRDVVLTATHLSNWIPLRILNFQRPFDTLKIFSQILKYLIDWFVESSKVLPMFMFIYILRIEAN